MKNLILVLLFALLDTNLAKAQSHGELILGLISDSDITHTAINSGSWFDAQTWDAGVIPNDHAWVLIPDGIRVLYDQESQTLIRGIESRGVLKFSPNQSSLLRVDTLVIEHTGELIIGTENNPVMASVNVHIEIVDNGNIDLNRDPSMFGRGILSMGRVRMHGEVKTTHLKVANDPLIGHTQITLAESPINWQVGDTLVLAGTKYSGWKWDNDAQSVLYHGTQDEIITITDIQGNVISFDTPLQYDHFTPRVDLKTSVGNYSRNITIATENPESTPRHRRGHVMFVHHANVDVRYASFWQLGRTSKFLESFEADDIVDMQVDSNVRARYPFHFHRSGVEDIKNPAISIGNSVFGSPGWGYVHHDSNAILHNNVSYDTFGAGFVAETGNEIGVWTNNLAIKAEGNSAFNPKNGNPRETFDIGRTGDGFWFQGRMVRANDNIAASVNHGYVYLHRGSGMLSFPGSIFMFPEALARAPRLTNPDDTPILNFDNNESFASTVGIYVVKANPNQQHDIRSHLSRFTAWEVQAGAAIEYTSHYLLSDFDIIGMTPESFRAPLFGIDFGNNSSDMSIVNTHIKDMAVGVGLGKHFTSPTPAEANQYVLVDVTYENVTTELVEYDPLLDQVFSMNDIVHNRFIVNLDNSDPYEYLSPATSAGSGVYYTGIKTDSIGDIVIPSGTDTYGTSSFDMIGIVSQDGYYRTENGAPYAIVEEFYSDRLTGKIHKLGLKTLLGPQVDAALGNPFSAWSDAIQIGIIDIESNQPIAFDDSIMAALNSTSKIFLLANDSDPDSDDLSIDGIVQPQHGRVFLNSDNSIEYIPDFDFLGADYFSYWATDGNGNYSNAEVVVQVIDDILFRNGFAE
ncbi:MAG: Ig-like domain-containing protein [Marinicellaceae bacterium]